MEALVRKLDTVRLGTDVGNKRTREGQDNKDLRTRVGRMYELRR